MRFIREKLLESESARESGRVFKGLDFLDVGCGGGLFSEVLSPLFLVTRCPNNLRQSLARLGANTLGVDASQANISVANLHASQDPGLALGSSLSYLHTPAEALLTDPKRYDVVCSMEVLEHVDNPASFLDTCAQLVKVCRHVCSRCSFSFCPARWTSFSIYDLPHRSRVLPHHIHG